MPKVSDDRLVNEGPLAEQFIGQHLVDHIRNKTGNELNYWLREGKQTNAEIDFVIALNGTIIPIEVKAGKAGSLKSLHQFMFEKKLKTAIRFDCNTPLKQKISTKIQTKQGQMQVEYELVSLPLYLVESIFNA